jgi:hypothetical protein
LGVLRFWVICGQKREPTSGLEPLTPAHYEFACVHSSPS